MPLSVTQRNIIMVGLVFFFHGKKNVCFRLNFLLIKTCYLLLDVIQMLRSGLGWYFLLHSKHKCDFWCFRDIYQTLLPILLYTFTSGRGWGSSAWERFLYLLFTDCLTLYSFSPLNLFCFPVWSYSVKTMESNSSKKAELCVGTLCWGDIITKQQQIWFSGAVKKDLKPIAGLCQKKEMIVFHSSADENLTSFSHS